MANVYDSNPILIDTVGGDLDIANLSVGKTDAPIFIKSVVYTGGTAADTVQVTNARGEIVVDITVPTAAREEERNFTPSLHSQGLKVINANTTITSGKVLIYLA